MTVRVPSLESDIFFHSHEIRELKADDEKITVNLTNKDTIKIWVNHPKEILGDILKAIEDDEYISLSLNRVEIS